MKNMITICAWLLWFFVTFMLATVTGETLMSCETNRFCRTVEEFNGEPAYLPICCKGANMQGRKLDMCMPACLVCLKFEGNCVENEPGYVEKREYVFNCKSDAYCGTIKQIFGTPVAFSTCCEGYTEKNHRVPNPACTGDCDMCHSKQGTCIDQNQSEKENNHGVALSVGVTEIFAVVIVIVVSAEYTTR